MDSIGIIGLSLFVHILWCLDFLWIFIKCGLFTNIDLAGSESASRSHFFETIIFVSWPTRRRPDKSNFEQERGDSWQPAVSSQLARFFSRDGAARSVYKQSTFRAARRGGHVGQTIATSEQNPCQCDRGRQLAAGRDCLGACRSALPSSVLSGR